MADQCQGKVFGVNALTVIAHLNSAASRMGKGDFDLAGSGINGILHQLLNHRRGPLNNLTGCH